MTDPSVIYTKPSGRAQGSIGQRRLEGVAAPRPPDRPSLATLPITYAELALRPVQLRGR
jgi:hypothetical protein